MDSNIVIPFLRSSFNYDRDAASNESALICLDPTRTQQQFKDETDINTIVERFGLTGELPDNVRMPQYADYGDIVDYHTAMNAVALANESFDMLPAKVRSRFHNDPSEFVDFCLDDNNRAEAIKLGLVDPEVLKRTTSPAEYSPSETKAPPAPSDFVLDKSS